MMMQTLLLSCCIIYIIILQLQAAEMQKQLATSTRLDETGCPVTFLGRCYCGNLKTIYDGYKEKKFTVNCTYAGFTETTMLQNLPEETEVLIFKGNTIPKLPANIFGLTKELDFLDVIDLSSNHIRIIQGKTFHKVYSVKTLVLDHNELEVDGEKNRPRIFSNFDNLERLHLTDAFTEKINVSDALLSLEDIFFESELKYLKVLHLEQNEIWTIGDNERLFCELDSLEQLHLGENRLSDLDFDVDCLKNLRYLDLQRNNVARFSARAMDQLTRLNALNDAEDLQIKLSKNPFNCDCRSSSFLHWFQTTEIDFVDEENYICTDGFPSKNIDQPLNSVHELLCPDPNYATYSSSTVGALTFFMVFFCCLLLVVVFMQREKVKKFVLPYWDFFTRKIGYHGLSGEEVAREVNV